MTNPHAENNDDIENVEAWAEIFGEILDLIPRERRAQVLALATKTDEAEKAKARSGELPYVDLSVEPDLHHWNAIMRLRSLIIQVFARRIANNHSKQEAAAILFARHPHGHGSRCLSDYLPPAR